MASSLILRLFTLLGLMSLVFAGAADEPATYLQHQRRALEKSHHHYRRSNITTTTNVTEAQIIVDAAVAQQGEYNAWRVQNPRRNNYYASNLPRPDGVNAESRKRDSSEPSPPVLNSTVRAAAALLAEHNANQQASNGTLHKIYQQPTIMKRTDDSPSNAKRAATPYWLGEIDHTGLAPMGQNSSWLVFRDVTDPIFAGGAKGDGITDDTAAINAAIKYGGNCGSGCLSSSVKGTLIYFPPGTYLISTPIQAYYYSQLVGNPNDMPIIKTAANFIGLGAIETDVYQPNANGDEWYINQSNFYRQVRNFIIDIEDTVTDSVAGLHWQVAQATSLTNVLIYAPTDSDTTAMGMFTENGSSGFMGECFFYGGKYGLYGGNQQYTVRSFEFVGQTTASICLIWDWGWTWSSLKVADSPIGIMLINPDAPSGQQAGSIYVMDSEFYNVGSVIFANSQPSTILESSVITLDNIGVDAVTEMVTFSDGTSLVLPVQDTDFVMIGNIEADGSAYGSYTVGVNHPSPDLTFSKKSYARDVYFYKSRPQYEDIDVSSIINVKDLGAKGDGVSDDTSIIGRALAAATEDNLIYFPAGSYIITETLQLNPGTRITGEVWSQLVASGDYFADEQNPKPLVKVGATSGQTGVVEITDILFTSIGELPGLVMVEWNMAADEQGSAALWDSHFRVGGAAGTNLQVADCPKGAAIQDKCKAAAMMLHITEGGNGYFENMWAWVADHDLDDAQNTMVSVAVARGILIESPGPTWLYGSASEHSILYQYNFYAATNVWAGMIQTEQVAMSKSPYFQYTAEAESPSVFSDSVGLFNNDPEFPDDTCNADDLMCNFSWAVMLQATTNVTIAGAGLYSWFANYDQSVCVDAQNCQQRLFNNQGANEQFYLFNLVTIGAVEMISDTLDGTIIYAANNTQAAAHPYWSILGAYLDDYTTQPSFCADDDTSAECQVAPNCDYTLSFSSIDDLDAASGDFPDECTEYYMLGVLSEMLASAMDDYASANDGYDSLFDYYVKSVKNMVPSALAEFMADSLPDNLAGGAGNKYFTCDFVELPLKTNRISYDPCPPPYNQISYESEYTITYTFKDEAGFYSELSDTYGVEQAWVELGNEVNKATGPCAGSGGGAAGRPDLDKRACEDIDIEHINIPVANTSAIVVSNPKDIVTSALPTLGTLQATILARQMDLIMGQWSGPTDDIIQVASMPVFLMVQAIQSMVSAKQQAEDEKSAEDKQLILEILGIVFAFIPFLGEFTPALEGLDVALEIVSAAGNAGLAIADIVAHPEDAPMELLGALTGGVTKTESDMSALAKARRESIVDDVKTKIGTTFKALDDKMQNLLKVRKCA